MASFDNPKIKNNKIGKKPYYTNIIYPHIPADFDDSYIVTKNGDRLDLLAEEFYGDSSLYWVIASANPENTRNDSFFLNAGVQIRIPSDLESIKISFNNVNKRR